MHISDRRRVVISTVATTTTRGWRSSDPTRSETVTDTTRLRFEGVETAVALDRRGDPTWVTYDGVSLLKSDSHGKASLLTNAQIDLTRRALSSGALLSVNGKAPEVEVDAALSILLTKRAFAPSDDTVWGAPLPQGRGARWPVRTDPWLSWLRDENDAWNSVAATGDATLEGSTTIGGIPCLDVTAHVELTGLPSFKSEGVLMDVTKKALAYTWHAPIDTSLPLRGVETEDVLQFKSHATSDEGMLFETEQTSHWTTEFTPL